MESKENNKTSDVQTKAVRNRGKNKVELIIDGKVVSFLPGKVVEVPLDFYIPEGIGLYVK